MKRKLVSLLLTIILTASVIGCGKEEVQDRSSNVKEETEKVDSQNNQAENDNVESNIIVNEPSEENRGEEPNEDAGAQTSEEDNKESNPRGTGIEKSMDYVPSGYKSQGSFSQSYLDMYEMEVEENVIDLGMESISKITEFRIKFLKDEDLQDKINEKITEMLRNLDEYASEHQELKYTYRDWGHFEGLDKEIQIEVMNGFLSVLIGFPSDEEKYNVNLHNSLKVIPYQYCETICFDLANGEEVVEFSDLFYANENFTILVNDILVNNVTDLAYTGLPYGDYTEFIEAADKFTLTSICIEDTMISYEAQSIMDSSIVWKYYDMKPLFANENRVQNVEMDEYEYDVQERDNYRYVTIKDSRFYGKEEIEALNNSYIHMQSFYFDSFGIEAGYVLDIIEKEDSYVLVTDKYAPYEMPRMHFDKETLEPFFITTYLSEGWEEYLIEAYGSDATTIISTREYDPQVFALYYGEDFFWLTLYSFPREGETRTTYEYKLPNEYLIMRD